MGRQRRHRHASPRLPSSQELQGAPAPWLQQMIQQLDPASRLSLFRCSTGLAEAVVQHAPNTLLKLSSSKAAARVRRKFSMQLAAKASNLHLWLSAAAGDLATLYNTDCWNQLKHLTLEDTAVDSVQYQHLHVEQLLSLVSLRVLTTGSTHSIVGLAVPVEKLRHSVARGHLPMLSSLHIVGASYNCCAHHVRTLGEIAGHQIKELVLGSWEGVPAISAFPALTSIKVQTARSVTNVRVWELLRLLAKHPKLQHVAVPSWPTAPDPAINLSCSWSSLHITHTVCLNDLTTLPDGLQSLQLSGEVQLTSQAASQKSLQVLAQLPQVVWSPHVYRTVKDNTAHWLEQKYIHVVAGQPGFAISYYREGANYSTDLQVLQACLPHLHGVLWLSRCDLTPKLLQAVATLLPASVHTLGLHMCSIGCQQGDAWAARWQLLPQHISHLVMVLSAYAWPEGALTESFRQLPLHVTKLTLVTYPYSRKTDPWKVAMRKQAAELRPDLQIKLVPRQPL